MGKLKIKPEHVELLRAGTRPYLNAARRKTYLESGLSEMRYRWDALWLARRNDPAMKDIFGILYAYANDDHVDTVLRRLAIDAERSGTA